MDEGSVTAMSVKPRRFRWIARDAASGEQTSGERQGESAYEVRAALRRVGLDVIQLDELAEPGSWHWWEPIRRTWRSRRRRQRRLAKADLCDAIATLLRVGAPLEQALRALEGSRLRTPGEQRLVAMLRERIRAGDPLSQAMSAQPDWFDGMDVALAQAGQEAGDLASGLEHMAQHHQMAGVFRQRLASALAYPMMLLVACIGVMVFMGEVTLPRLVDMLVQAHRPPPVLSVIVMAIGRGIVLWWPIGLGVLFFAWLLGAHLLARLPARLVRWWWRNPLARLKSQVLIAGFARTMARLRRAGIPLIDALGIVADSADDRRFGEALRSARQMVMAGGDLSAALAGAGVTDREFLALIQVGEGSGELTGLLDRISERYGRVSDRALSRLAAVIGPAATIALAFVIGIVVMASILPLVRLGDML